MVRYKSERKFTTLIPKNKSLYTYNESITIISQYDGQIIRITKMGDGSAIRFFHMKVASR